MATTKSRSKVIKSLRGGQITIPAEFRKELDIGDNSLLKVTLLEEGELRVRLLETVERPGGSEWLKELYMMFAPARQEAIDKGYTEEEINQWIDQAIKEVRDAKSANRD